MAKANAARWAASSSPREMAAPTELGFGAARSSAGEEFFQRIGHALQFFAAADGDPQMVAVGGGGETADRDTVLAQVPLRRLGGPRRVGETGENEIRLARHDGEAEPRQTLGEPGAAVPVRHVDRIEMAAVGKRGARGGHRDAGEWKRRGNPADVGDDLRRSVKPADARQPARRSSKRSGS